MFNSCWFNSLGLKNTTFHVLPLFVFLLQVGFFPSECVELINDKVPQSVTNSVPKPGMSVKCCDVEWSCLFAVPCLISPVNVPRWTLRVDHPSHIPRYPLYVSIIPLSSCHCWMSFTCGVLWALINVYLLRDLRGFKLVRILDAFSSLWLVISRNIVGLGDQGVLYVRVVSYGTYRWPKSVCADLEGID